MKTECETQRRYLNRFLLNREQSEDLRKKSIFTFFVVCLQIILWTHRLDGLICLCVWGVRSFDGWERKERVCFVIDF